MMIKTGGRKIVVNFTVALMLAAMAAGAVVAAERDGEAMRDDRAAHASEHPAEFLKGFFTAAIDVASHAAQATSDTLHHSGRNVVDSVVKARGFVRDTVSGVLGNARKVSGMVGDVMPFTQHNHYEGTQPPEKTAKTDTAE